MKVAIGFYGKSDTLVSHWDKKIYNSNIELLLNISSNSLKNNVINCNKDYEFDFFFHTWTSKFNDKVLSLFKFKNYMFENPIKLENKEIYLKNRPNDYHCSLLVYNIERSRLHSMNRVLRIIKNYKIKYDIIMLLRFDVHFNTEINLANLTFHKNVIFNPSHMSPIIDKNLSNCDKNKLKKYKLFNTYFYKNIFIKTYDDFTNNFYKNISNYHISVDRYCDSDFLYIFNYKLIYKFIESVENCSRYIRANGAIPLYLNKYNIKFQEIKNFYEPLNIGLTREIYLKFFS